MGSSCQLTPTLLWFKVHLIRLLTPPSKDKGTPILELSFSRKHQMLTVPKSSGMALLLRRRHHHTKQPRWGDGLLRHRDQASASVVPRANHVGSSSCSGQVPCGCLCASVTPPVNQGAPRGENQGEGQWEVSICGWALKPYLLNVPNPVPDVVKGLLVGDVIDQHDALSGGDSGMLWTSCELSEGIPQRGSSRDLDMTPFPTTPSLPLLGSRTSLSLVSQALVLPPQPPR